MRLSIQRLRWVLLAGAMLLVGVLVLYIGYGRYRSMKAYIDIIKRSGAMVTHDTNGYTYSQSVQGKTIFTLHAKRATQLGDGKWTLHDAEMTLYNRSPGRPDHIYSSEIDYDQNEGVARAQGEVHMDLQPPQTLTGSKATAPEPEADTSVSPQVMHIRTSGLVYLRKLGVATTDQQVEFHYGAVTCTAVGAEFNTDQSALHLLSNVMMDGDAHGQPVHLTATKADMDRNANIVHVTAPVVTSQGRNARADAAVLDLRKDGSIQDLLATGAVMMSSGTQQVTADRLYATLSAQTVLQTATLTGNVLLMGTDPLRPIHGTASQVDAAFDAKGAPKSAVATGGVKVSMVDHKANARGLMRSMEGAKMTVLFVPGAKKQNSHRNAQSAQLSEIHAVGSAHMQSETLTVASASSRSSVAPKMPQLKTVQVAADDLRVLFANSAEGRAEPQKLFGEGHTQLQQDAPMDEQEISHGDALEMAFALASGSNAAALTLSHAVQSGHFSFRDRAATKPDPSKPGATLAGDISTGSADRAVYDEATGHVTLSGNAHMNGNNAEIIAPTLSLDQHTQDAEASGGVQATLRNAQQAAASNASPAPITHVLSTSARFFHASKVSEFHGTDAVPAKMWQDASQVQAATLIFDGIQRTLSARPMTPGTPIHAVFAATPKADAKPGAARIVRIASPKMDYNDLQREATFTNGVILDGALGEARSQRAVVFLTPAKTPEEKRDAVSSSGTFSGSLDRVVLSGEVQMEQPGRTGTGDQLLYTAATENYVLTGTPTHPPHITDAKQGSVTGTTLLFGDAGSTIIVVGDPGSKKRVRTETEVRQ